MNRFNIDDEVFYIALSDRGDILVVDKIRAMRKEGGIVVYEFESGRVTSDLKVICDRSTPDIALAVFVSITQARIVEMTAFIEDIKSHAND